MSDDPKFVDRQQEVDTLQSFAERNEAVLALVYGRRRIGKTYMLDRAFRGRHFLYFLATDTTAELNRRQIVEEIGEWSERELYPEDYPSWRSVFRLMVREAEREPLVVVLDEFQYLLGGEDDITSQLVAVWDREVEGVPLTLVLCGSEVATMAKLGAGDAPLYGRIDWRCRLRAFDYLDTSRMVPEWDERTATYTYGIFGGTPKYLANLRPGESLGDNVCRELLSEQGAVHLQLENLIAQEKGIRKTAEYRAVLAAVGAGRTEINEIAQQAGLGARQHAVRRILGTLVELELLRRERNFDAGKTTPYRYRIADPALRFWYRFVHPHLGHLLRQDPETVWKQAIRPQLDTYMGRVFEEICHQAYRRHHEAWDCPPASRWARWEGRDRNRRDIEIDVVARLLDGRILTGEAKWSSSPVDVSVHARLRQNLEALAASGRGWANEALDEERSAGHIYFSAAGFTDGFRRRAADEGNVTLISLENMYEER